MTSVYSTQQVLKGATSDRRTVTSERHKSHRGRERLDFSLRKNEQKTTSFEGDTRDKNGAETSDKLKSKSDCCQFRIYTLLLHKLSNKREHNWGTAAQKSNESKNCSKREEKRCVIRIYG